MGYLENTLCYTTPFKNSEKSVKNQALIYVSTLKLNAFRFLERGTVCNISYNRIVINHV